MLEQGPPSVRRFDATRLAKRISQSQEITGQHRVGTVNTVNTDGTVDVDLAGTVIPDVPTVGGVTVGGSVQLLVWQGDLLALAYTGPRGVLGYDETFSDTTGVTSETTISGISVTVDVPANRLSRMSCRLRIQSTSTGATTAIVRFKEGAATLQQAARVDGINSAAEAHQDAYGTMIFTPSAGSHTYTLSLERSSGSVSIRTIYGSFSPGWLLVEDIGAA